MRSILTSVVLLLSLQTVAQQKPIPSGVYHWADVPVTKSDGREGRKFMEGGTAELEYFELHATTQAKGAAPKPAHAQTDIEELLFIKEGQAKFILGAVSKVLGKGSLILIPPNEMQAIQNVGDGPLTYYVLMFRSKKKASIWRGRPGAAAR